jgi:hypothetical protein
MTYDKSSKLHKEVSVTTNFVKAKGIIPKYAGTPLVEVKWMAPGRILRGPVPHQLSPKTPSPFLTVTIMFEHIGEEKVHISFVIFDI